MEVHKCCGFMFLKDYAPHSFTQIMDISHTITHYKIGGHNSLHLNLLIWDITVFTHFTVFTVEKGYLAGHLWLKMVHKWMDLGPGPWPYVWAIGHSMWAIGCVTCNRRLVVFNLK